MEMTDNDKVPGINLTSSAELTASLTEQLRKAFIELEARKVASTTNKVQWNDVEEHFQCIGSTIRKKLEELGAKEKEFAERESHYRSLIASREAALVAKEQDMLDRVQELKDAAVAAILEARENHASDSVPLASCWEANGDQVCSSTDGENTPLDDGNEVKSPHKSAENAEDLASEVNPRTELIQFCEQMDVTGLLNFLTENLENLSVMENLKDLSGVCKEQLSVVLVSATEPARLVLDALEGFLPASDRDDRDAAVSGKLQSCLILLESLSAFLSKADFPAEHFVNPEIKQQALSTANKWKPKLAGENTDAADGNSLEAEGFLTLVATFRMASEFDEEELCKYVLAVAHHRQAIELCRSLELTQKIPGLVEELIRTGRQIDAVHFIHAFGISDAFPSVALLKAYLKELRRTSQGNGKASLQNKNNARELAALRAVIECVEEYNLEADYPLDTLRKRVSQLEGSVEGNRKRTRGETGNYPEKKRRWPCGEFQAPPLVPLSSSAWRLTPQPFPQRAELMERYPPTILVPNVHSYPLSGSSFISAQYAQDSSVRAPYSAVAPTFGAYTQPPSKH